MFEKEKLEQKALPTASGAEFFLLNYLSIFEQITVDTN